MGAPLKSWLRLDVRRIEENQAICQIVQQPEDVWVCLPLNLFPKSPEGRKPYIGASYRLTAVEEEISVEWYQGNREEHRELKNTIRDRVQQFSKGNDSE